MEDLTQKLIPFLLSPQFEGWLLTTKIAFIVLTFLFVIGIIIFLIESTWLKRLILEDTAEFLTFRPAGVRRIERVWLKTKVRLDTGLESEYKLAVIEADNILDDTLKRMEFSGETLGEKLRGLSAVSLPNIEEIKNAHQIRNNIIHDPDYRLSLEEARKTIDVYEKALRDLEAF